MPPLIEFQNLTVCRGEKVALDRITLSIDAGEHVAILGPNGSGKSSLIKTITRECYPRYSGNGTGLRIFGRERWNVFDLRALLGIVSNDLMNACARDISGREAVLSGFFSSVGIWPNHHVTAPMERKADEVLDLLEVTHLAARDVNEMSSGEARRILIGRALVHDPKALVLDEPTASLDLRAMHELRAILRKLARGGTSIIVVTHHLPDILPEMERVIMIRAGRILRDGPKRQVLTSESLSDLFGAPVELVERAGLYQIW
ncbi:MAG TPA: ATP-binding cassette domain-containing protein [Bryobacteraceae bacterium]|jgi:iron complex transport system ATP-binding protein|nr:ATP-binding cassette domain-containing protein [Bryobacteraceae bacterium]